MYYVYILENKNQKLYIGYTTDLRKRLKEHKKKSTIELIYYEACRAKKDATIREKQLKKYKSAWGYLKRRIKNSRI